jgi:hypothetical protein
VIKRGLPQHPVYMVIEFTILCAILRSGTLSCIAICMDRTNSAQMPNRPSADPDSRSLKFVCINKKKSGNKMLRDKRCVLLHLLLLAADNDCRFIVPYLFYRVYFLCGLRTSQNGKRSSGGIKNPRIYAQICQHSFQHNLKISLVSLWFRFVSLTFCWSVFFSF